MQRRDLLGMGAAALGLSACNQQTTSAQPVGSPRSKPIRWKMYTTWPRNFPGLGTGAAYLADSITRMSGGRLEVKLYGAGERVPALEVFDAVSRGSAEMGHGAAYYWKGKAAAAPFFTCVPFGLIAAEQNAWLEFGGGLELWRELYAQFNLVPYAAGNTGTQMGGWFRKPIKSLNDLKGLKMRMPGLGGEVLARLGVATVNIPGGELFTALSTGTIDATEWVGPYNDLAFGLHKAAKHYYYSGWHEPGPTLEAIVNQDALAALPDDLQAIVEIACQATNVRMQSEYVARNQQALNTLRNEHGVQVHAWPDEILRELRQTAAEVVQDIAESDAFAGRVYASYQQFREQAVAATRLAEEHYLYARRL